MNSLKEDEKVLIFNSETWAAKLNASENGRDGIYSPADLQVSWQIQPFWRNSLHTQYLEIDHSKFYVQLVEFNNISSPVNWPTNVQYYIKSVNEALTKVDCVKQTRLFP